MQKLQAVNTGFAQTSLADELLQPSAPSSQQQQQQQQQQDFEELIDLSLVDNKSVQLQSKDSALTEDLLNSNNVEEEKPTPLIAFEENPTIRQDNVPGN